MSGEPVNVLPVEHCSNCGSELKIIAAILELPVIEKIPKHLGLQRRILGRHQNGMGRTWDDSNHMKFFNDGLVNYPYLSDGMWFPTQHKRWGLLKDHPDYLKVAQQINQIRLYKQAAAQVKVSVPTSDMLSSKFIDGVVWDGTDSAKYAVSCKVRAAAA